MNLSLSSLLVVIVVVVGTLTNAAPRSGYGGDLGVRGWPWIPGYLPSLYSSPALFPSSSDEYLGSYGDYHESSQRKSMIEDFNRRVMDAQRRCHDDFMILRRLLEEQDNPLRGPTLDVPWYFPTFRFPFIPERGQDSESEEESEEENDKKKRKTPTSEENVDYDSLEDSETSLDVEDIESIFLNSPTPGPEWQIIPLLPEAPDADDLPDKYDNSTHKVHIINGSRVEVNTTTHKDSGDVVTTFFHTEVINILPEESEPEEDTTENPEGEEATDDEETNTEDSTKDIETHSEDSDLAVPAELKDLLEKVDLETETGSGSNINSISARRPTREFTESPITSSTSTTEPQAQHLAAYVKGGDTKGKKGKDSPARPRDLSGDTLVNKLTSGGKGGKKKEPDAEYISSEELL